MTRPPVAVISSLYGAYDQPASPVPQTVDAEWVMVTDQPAAPDPWQVITEPRPGAHPRLAAKTAKCRPDLYSDAEILIWIDASFQITSPDFVAWCVDQLGDAPIAQIRHPVRQSITDEAHASARMCKYDGLPLLPQVHHYVNGGHPDDWGLWATGLIVYRRNTCLILGDSWLAEQVRWTYQDQLSEPVLLRQFGITPRDLPGPLWEHPMFRIRPHESDL